MNEQMRSDLTPQEHIRHMFAETVDGKVTVGYEDPYNHFTETERTFYLNWTEEDAKSVEVKYNLLTSALARIGRLHDQLRDEENRGKLLSEADLEVFDTYVRPYDPMEVNWDELYPIPLCEQTELMLLICSIHERSQHGDLIEEEELLWKQYCIWEEEQSRKRIPFKSRSCTKLIDHERRYEKLISLNAPEVVVTEEGRCLAEEMVLYYFGKEEPIVWD